MDYKKILKEIKKFSVIIIARHIGADPDALGSSIGLKEIIKLNFPNKTVLAIGSPTSRFKYLGLVDKMITIDYSKALLIVVDTPDKKRVDGVNLEQFENVIKIDHHPFIENFGKIEIIDENASSSCQLIVEFAKINKLKLNEDIAMKLFLGIVADTNRFLYDYTSFKTLELTAWLIKKTNLNFTSLYSLLYNRPLKEIRFLGYLFSNIIITPSGFGYLKISDETLKEYEVDPSTAGNLIENFNNIQEAKIIAFCSEDKGNNYIKCSIRSKGPVINDITSKYNGGGHIYACGAKPKTFEEVDKMLKELESLCINYVK